MERGLESLEVGSACGRTLLCSRDFVARASSPTGVLGMASPDDRPDTRRGVLKNLAAAGIGAADATGAAPENAPPAIGAAPGARPRFSAPVQVSGVHRPGHGGVVHLVAVRTRER